MTQRLGQPGGSSVHKEAAADKKTGQPPHPALPTGDDQVQAPGPPLDRSPAGSEAGRKGWARMGQVGEGRDRTQREEQRRGGLGKPKESLGKPSRPRKRRTPSRGESGGDPGLDGGGEETVRGIRPKARTSSLTRPGQRKKQDRDPEGGQGRGHGSGNEGGACLNAEGRLGGSTAVLSGADGQTPDCCPPRKHRTRASRPRSSSSPSSNRRSDRAVEPWGRPVVDCTYCSTASAKLNLSGA